MDLRITFLNYANHLGEAIRPWFELILRQTRPTSGGGKTLRRDETRRQTYLAIKIHSIAGQSGPTNSITKLKVSFT